MIDHDFPYHYSMSKAEYIRLNIFLDGLRHLIGDCFNLTTRTSTLTPMVEIKTDSPHVTLFMLLLRLGVDV